MTRFARAKGSKASNEKLPEAATPWAEMKQELLNKNEELAEKQKREEALNRRQANYQAFLEEKEAEEDKQITWADFPGANKTVNDKGKSPKKRQFSLNDDDNKHTSLNGKRLKKDLPELKDDDISEESDEQFSALKSQIDRVLAKQSRNDDESDDDPPDEVSVKVKPQEIIVKKAKKPKQKLKILLDNKQLSKPNEVSNVVNQTEDKQPKKSLKIEKKETLTEKQKKLIQKKHDRHKKQMEKKKLKKKAQQEERAVVNTSVEVKIENKEPSSPNDPKVQKKLERRKKQKEKKKLKKLQSDGNVPFKKGENLSEDDLKKIQKKKAKAAKQAEKRKKFKQIQETPNNSEAQEDHSKEIKNNNNIDNSDEFNAIKPFKFNNHNNTDSTGSKPFQNHPATAKQKKGKIRDNKEHPSRKQRPEKMFINGKTIEIDYIEGFPVKKEDAERLKKLRKEMISKGLPRSEINAALKIERRRAEKALAREKKNVCFNCRQSGHNLSECPELDKNQVAQTAGTGICFKCGSTEHTHFECKVVKGQDYKFASCFICKEQGHIARQCPDNQRGLYPKGGSCKVCGDVTHLKKDCPKYQAQQSQLQNSLCIETISSGNPDDISTKGPSTPSSTNDRKLNKIIKF